MRLSIRAKFLLNAGVLMVFLAIMGGFGIAKMGEAQNRIQSMYERSFSAANKLAVVRFNLSSARTNGAVMVSSTDPQEVAKLVDAGNLAQQKALAALEEYRRLADTDEGRASATKITQAIQDFLVPKNKVYQLAQSGQSQAARHVMLTESKARFAAAIAAMDEGFALSDRHAKGDYQDVIGMVGLTRTMVMLLCGLAIAIGLGLSLFMSGSIARDLRKVTKAADGLANGELEQDVTMARADEIGDLGKSFMVMIDYMRNAASVAEGIAHGDLTHVVRPKSDRDVLNRSFETMIESLRDTVGRVSSAAEFVTSGATHLGSSSEELAKSVSTQASGAEQTSAAMEQMAANLQSVDGHTQVLGGKVTVLRQQSDDLAAAVNETSSSIAELAASIHQVSGNISKANHLSQQNSEAAVAGEHAVARTIDGMRAISDTMSSIRTTILELDSRSREIGAIIEVIDDIAEQTNLLALNAAIEAARAGDAGRGFAVVADEVRKLAERSAKATKEIGDLIKSVQAETAQAVAVTKQGAQTVAEGTEIVGTTGAALMGIKDAASQVGRLLQEVALATDEQTRSSGLIVKAAEQMAGINQQVTDAIMEMERLTKSVSYATSEQRQGSDQVLMAVEGLSRSSQEAATVTEQVARAASELEQQSRTLRAAVAVFKLDGGRVQLHVSSNTPMALPARV